MKKNQGVIFIILCVIANFFSQIFFNDLAKNTLSKVHVDYGQIEELFSIILTSQMFYIGLILFALSALFWILGLKTTSLSKGYAITSLNYILITIFAMLWLDESFTLNKLLSCIFITLGVILMNKKFKTI